eukprot:scaffold5380_cov131-Cylindrotheca_fusiformis.AAC.20
MTRHGWQLTKTTDHTRTGQKAPTVLISRTAAKRDWLFPRLFHMVGVLRYVRWTEPFLLRTLDRSNPNTDSIDISSCWITYIPVAFTIPSS